MWGEPGTVQTLLVQYREKHWVPGPGSEASWKEYGSLQMIKKDISLGGLNRASSLIFQCLAQKEVPPGILKPSGDPYRS